MLNNVIHQSNSFVRSRPLVYPWRNRIQVFSPLSACSLYRFSTRTATDRPRQPKFQSTQQLELQNDAFDRYYKIQNIVPKVEWPAFLSSLRQPLPLGFRITASHQESIDETVDGLIGELQDVGVEARQLKWYHRRLGWDISVGDKSQQNLEMLGRAKGILTSYAARGRISRQETSSMLPVLLLDCQPNEKILDICAAPGSKTLQVLHELSLRSHHLNNESSSLVIANDPKDLRVEQMSRRLLESKMGGLEGLMVTQCFGELFPELVDGEGNGVKFDKILCDVPCSSDGTLRKVPELWHTWSPQTGNEYHELQLKILLRAVDLLVPGGRLVYSTCSLNPVENEAVIASAVTSRPGLKIIDISQSVPDLNSRPSLTSWTPHQSPETIISTVGLKRSHSQMESQDSTRTLYPPTTNVENLDKCMRLLPHVYDGGGFFIAVLSKDALAEETKAAKLFVPGAPRPKSAQNIKFISADETEMIKNDYGLVDFPMDHLFVKPTSTERCDRIFLVNPLVKAMLLSNPTSHPNVAGREIFRQSKVFDCGLVISSHEEVRFLWDYVHHERRLHLERNDFKLMLKQNRVTLSEMSQQFQNAMRGYARIYLAKYCETGQEDIYVQINFDLKLQKIRIPLRSHMLRRMGLNVFGPEEFKIKEQAKVYSHNPNKLLRPWKLMKNIKE